MEKIKISEDTPLKPGDEIEIHAKRFGFGIIKDMFGAITEARLRSNPRYDVYDWKIGDDVAIYKVRIKEPAGEVYKAGIITPGIIIAAIWGVSLMFVSITVYKVVDQPAGKAALVGVGGLGIAAAALILLKSFKGK